ncbi:hypothetical protein V8G54_026351 [Vigna mungo]|uniref:Uncharacterized protein n=1 Tax=Vigna mungo TaxID=3915 RepID=A0AAQ3N048_VIGMU
MPRFGRFNEEHASFAVFMAAVGVLRALERRGVGADLVSGMGVKDCVVGRTESLVSDLVSRRLRFGYSGDNEGDVEEDRLLLRICFSYGCGICFGCDKTQAELQFCSRNTDGCVFEDTGFIFLHGVFSPRPFARVFGDHSQGGCRC